MLPTIVASVDFSIASISQSNSSGLEVNCSSKFLYVSASSSDTTGGISTGMIDSSTVLASAIVPTSPLSSFGVMFNGSVIVYVDGKYDWNLGAATLVIIKAISSN